MSLPKSKRVTCSNSCRSALQWRDPESAERRRQSIIVARRTPESRQRAIDNNHKRWGGARPGEREKLSERTRKRWADPYQNAKQAVAIQKVRLQPEKRKIASDRRQGCAAPNPSRYHAALACADRSQKLQ